MIEVTSPFHGMDVIADDNTRDVASRYVLETTLEEKLDYRYYNDDSIPGKSKKIDLLALISYDKNDDNSSNQEVDSLYLLNLIKATVGTDNFLVSESATEYIEFIVESYNSNLS